MIDASSPNYCALSIQPIIQINYIDGQQTTKNKILTVKIYKFIDDSLIQKQFQNILNSTNKTFTTFDSMLEDSNNQNNQSIDVKKTLSNMWSIVTNAGKLKSEVVKTSEKFDIFFTKPNETTDSKFFFTDLKIKFGDYGKYQLIFIVDGIESDLSDVIEIKKNRAKVKEEKVDFLKVNLSY